MADGIVIIPGPIRVDGINGRITEHGFVLRISTGEKYVDVDVACDACDEDTDTPPYTDIMLSADERTRRSGEPLPAAERSGFTMIRVPGRWLSEACRGRYTAVAIGIPAALGAAKDELEYTEGAFP